METASVVPTPATWLPDDDILLKNAIEEGASLEALARGAVPFSRTFTLQEVHDRWYSLLYDPEISAQACVHLCLDESDKPKEISARHRKRKVGTLRKRYHDRVKRIRNEFLSSADLEFFNDEPQVGNTVLEDGMPDPFGLQVADFNLLHQPFPQVLTDLAASNGVSNAGDAFHSKGPNSPLTNLKNETAKDDCLRGFPVPDLSFPVQGSLRIDGMPPFRTNNIERDDVPNSLHDNFTDNGKCLLSGGELSNSNVYTMGFSPPLPNMSHWKSMEDEAAPNMSANVLPCDKNYAARDVLELPDNGDSKGKKVDKQNRLSFISSTSISDGELADLPDSLFDFQNVEMLFMDVDGKDPVDKSCCNNKLSRVPMDIDALEVGEKAKVVAKAGIATEPEVGTSHLHTVLGAEKPVSHVKVQTSSGPTLNNKPGEHSPGILYCPLNTEDPDIPCNDDIFLLIHPDAPNASSARTSIIKGAMDPVSAKERNSMQAIKRREELAHSYKHSLMFSSYKLPETGHVHTGGGLTIRAETNSSKDLLARHKAVVDPTQCKPSQKSLVSSAKGNLDKDLKKVDSGAVETPAILKGLPRHTKAGGVDVSLSEPEINPSTSDLEGAESENMDPHFSDIEAMILDMDLRSYDDDLHYTRKVSKYQQENSKKTIMRLEQCARASIQRAMTSKGAIAVLYGRRSRHFIRKKEVVILKRNPKRVASSRSKVILGRSTAETAVDVDLGKEGSYNNKISRRQAIVKMEDNGTFSLKNIARNPMSVNGSEVGTGESKILSSSCLIEIRGITFVFESNQKYVKSYLKNISSKSKEQMARFKCVTKQEQS